MTSVEESPRDVVIRLSLSGGGMADESSAATGSPVSTDSGCISFRRAQLLDCATRHPPPQEHRAPRSPGRPGLSERCAGH